MLRFVEATYQPVRSVAPPTFQIQGKICSMPTCFQASEVASPGTRLAEILACFQQRCLLICAPLCQVWQGQHQIEIVIGGDAILALDPAFQAGMHQRIFAVGPRKIADRCHRAATGAEAVTWHALIHMPRMQTVGAVIAVPPAAGDKTNHHAAVPTPELFGLVGTLAMRRRARAILGWLVALRASGACLDLLLAPPTILLAQQIGRVISLSVGLFPGVVQGLRIVV